MTVRGRITKPRRWGNSTHHTNSRKRTSTGPWCDQYWSPIPTSTGRMTKQYWSIRRPVLVENTDP